MSHAVFHRSHALRQPVARRVPRRLPRGYGLLFGAIVSLGLWAAAIWLAAWLIG